jgi:hypothetical protein
VRSSAGARFSARSISCSVRWNCCRCAFSAAAFRSSARCCTRARASEKRSTTAGSALSTRVDTVAQSAAICCRAASDISSVLATLRVARDFVGRAFMRCSSVGCRAAPARPRLIRQARAVA